MAALTVLELGQHRIGHVDVVTVPRTIGDTEGVHVRVLAQVLQLTLLVVRIDRHQHGSNLRCGIEERQPVGHVRGPDTNIRTPFHTDGNQSLGKVVHSLIELTPREAQITVAIYNVFFIRCSLCPMLEPLTEGALMELIAGTACLGRVCPVWQRSACHI